MCNNTKESHEHTYAPHSLFKGSIRGLSWQTVTYFQMLVLESVKSRASASLWSLELLFFMKMRAPHFGLKARPMTGSEQAWRLNLLRPAVPFCWLRMAWGREGRVDFSYRDCMWTVQYETGVSFRVLQFSGVEVRERPRPDLRLTDLGASLSFPPFSSEEILNACL